MPENLTWRFRVRCCCCRRKCYAAVVAAVAPLVLRSFVPQLAIEISAPTADHLGAAVVRPDTAVDAGIDDVVVHVHVVFDVVVHVDVVVDLVVHVDVVVDFVVGVLDDDGGFETGDGGR